MKSHAGIYLGTTSEKTESVFVLKDITKVGENTKPALGKRGNGKGACFPSGTKNVMHSHGCPRGSEWKAKY